MSLPFDEHWFVPDPSNGPGSIQQFAARLDASSGRQNQCCAVGDRPRTDQIVSNLPSRVVAIEYEQFDSWQILRASVFGKSFARPKEQASLRVPSGP